MRVIVIGASGTIGKAVAEALAARHEVVRVSRTQGDMKLDMTDKAAVQRFFQEVGYPAPIDLGVVAERVGRSSIVYRVGFFQGDGDQAAAEGRAVMVYVDNTDPARPSTPLPDVVRRAAEALLR